MRLIEGGCEEFMRRTELRPRSNFCRPLLAIAVVLSFTPALEAGNVSLLEVTHQGQKFQGKLEAKSSNVCWLMGRDGQLAPFEINQIDSIRTVAPRFRAFSLAELRDQLRRELPRQFRIDGTGHFLICAEKNSRRIGEICEDTYRTFHRYFSVRGFKISQPEFPLVVIVFPDRSNFAAYCRKDGIEPPAGLLGYYMRLTNRVALFDAGEKLDAGGSASARATSAAPGSLALTFDRDEEHRGRLLAPEQLPAALAPVRFDAMVEGNLQNTIVHETTHQLAFNMGLHSRIGQTPKWVIEGLATMFEAPGIRDSQKSASPKSRINRNRFVWFGNYMQSRRNPHSLDDFVATDDLYASATLDAYAEGWALTFFLAETRHASYGRYLKSIAQRNPLVAYTAAERVADFRKAFGDTKYLEADFMRFFEKLK
jgi:hypothetical protein